MIKKVCYCDKCEAVAENPVVICFGYLDVESGEVDEWPDMPKELCESCANRILFEIMEKHTPVEKAGRPANLSVDRGKIVALRTAGWPIKDIAEEMKLTSRHVSQILYLEKKKQEEKENKNESEAKEDSK